MYQQRFNSISFEDALAISQQRYKETADEVRDLRRELRERDARLQAMLGEQCALKLNNRELTEALRKIESSLALLLRENPSLFGGITTIATPAGMLADSDRTRFQTFINVGMQLCPMDAIRALSSNKKNYIARLPFEMRGDILLNLDRFSLDRAGFACPQFHAVVSCLVGGSLRALASARLYVSKSAGNEWHTTKPNIRISVEYFSDPMARKRASTGEMMSRQWSFSDTAMATSQFISLLRHASVQQMSLSGPLPLHLLERY